MITQHANAVQDGVVMVMVDVQRCVVMVLLWVERNVTAHLDAVILDVSVNKTTHTTMRVGCACIVGMGLLRVQRNVT